MNNVLAEKKWEELQNFNDLLLDLHESIKIIESFSDKDLTNSAIRSMSTALYNLTKDREQQ